MPEYDPKIVFISETRQQNSRVENLRWRLSLKNCYVVNGEGKGGGLALNWDESVSLDILSYSQHHIDTFVYGEPGTQDLHLMWDLLRRIKDTIERHG